MLISGHSAEPSEGALKPPDLVRPGSMASDSLTRWSKELGWSENNTSLSVIIVVLSRQVLNVQKQLAKEMLRGDPHHDLFWCLSEKLDTAFCGVSAEITC